ncbi:hypothetical protein VSR01_25750 [Actinacidiphila sp. DG2A-62]|jgi:hypothetical protein|uniref:hypothetical protein n=1 Tax=Actinacidiphila sp. DG2A-62 TaxID=3108821 RepID=UPI002DB99718|nr:hypothetical protein [Actinacidiphila sp. DG2A-62]MEC3996725.1 hypothetical protein [Actinacidiphila sp. DG2A-62]
MLVEALMALSATGGGAIAQAAGTDVWHAVRGRIARLLGRGDEARERVELERLDRTRAALEAAAGGEADQVRAEHAAVWRSRLELLLEELPEPQRQEAAAELRAVVEAVVAASPAGGQSVHNDFSGATFTKSAVQGGGTQHNTFN